MFLNFRRNAFVKLCMLWVMQIIVNDCAGYAPPPALESTTEGHRHLDDISTFSWNVYCKLQPNKFICGKILSSTKYYYDLHAQECLRFDYGHCEVAYNRFDDRHVCMKDCQDDAFKPVPENMTANIYCRFQPDFGNCNSYIQMYYFDMSDQRCKGFGYSGCGGNYNRFPSQMACQTTCGVFKME